MHNKNAFTLVEIVVAMAIIGIIASLTIPTFFANSISRNNQYVAGLKKAYGELSYATDQIKAKNNGTFKYAYTGGADKIRDLFLPYMKVGSTCNYGTADEKCWHADNVVKLLKGAIDPSNRYWTSKMVLNNGSLVLFVNRGNDCNFSYGGIKNICSEVYIDVNGFKPPNQWGRDLHFFWINKDGIKPMVYTNGGTTNCSLVTAADYIDGSGCAAKVLREGKMLY